MTTTPRYPDIDAATRWRLIRHAFHGRSYPAREVDRTDEFPGTAVRRLRRPIALTPETPANPLGLRRRRASDSLELSQVAGPRRQGLIAIALLILASALLYALA